LFRRRHRHRGSSGDAHVADVGISRVFAIEIVMSEEGAEPEQDHAADPKQHLCSDEGRGANSDRAGECQEVAAGQEQPDSAPNPKESDQEAPADTGSAPHPERALPFPF
jgi:hypothetical protein